MPPGIQNDQPKSDSPESRIAERVKLDVSIAYSLETFRQAQERNSPYRWGTLLDISERGLCFKASDRFFLERLLSLYLKLSHESRGIKMLGKVIWTGNEWDGSTRVGIQFIGTLPSDWRKLTAHGGQPDKRADR